MTSLVTLLGDRVVGQLARDKDGRLSFRYDEQWCEDPDAYPVSVSMPLALIEHGHRAVEAYIWGLLPDNELIISRWAKRFKVSARNAFGLMAHVGEDCAGAVRFVLPERLDALPLAASGSIAWLSELEVGARLRELRDDISAWRLPNDGGQFSLAGAQPKTALAFDGRRWGVPSGNLATTHILKPAALGLDGHAENEHFCLALCRELGLPAAASRVVRFGDETAVVVERYDRVRIGRQVVRVHQEDVCQALAVLPSHKYENEGGPGVRPIVELLREHSRRGIEDVATFVGALAFNWLVAGTDAHAKNYSLLIGSGGGVRLAPLYDVASALPYRGVQLQKLALAMKIGGKYRVRDIGVHEWTKLAHELRIDDEALLTRVRQMAEALPDAVTDRLQLSRRDGLSHPVLDRLAEAMIERATRAAKSLRARRPGKAS